MVVTPLQGLRGVWERLTWASARRTRFSPGCHIGGFQPRQQAPAAHRARRFLRAFRAEAPHDEHGVPSCDSLG